MKITLTRKTSAWGALRYFTFYKNGVHQGKLFTNVPIEIEADPGDVLTFYEGWFQFYRALKLLKIPKKSRLSILKNCNTFFIPVSSYF